VDKIRGGFWISYLKKLFNCNVFANITDTQETRRSTPFAKTDYCLHQNYRDLPASTAAVPETNSNLKFKKFAKNFKIDSYFAYRHIDLVYQITREPQKNWRSSNLKKVWRQTDRHINHLELYYKLCWLQAAVELQKDGQLLPSYTAGHVEQLGKFL